LSLAGIKVVILAGGFGTRISEETLYKPKPMVEIGNKPILWHIMKYYSMFGIKDFIICLGYKAEYVKSYFASYNIRNADFTVNLKTGCVEFLDYSAEDWNVSLVDTGLSTMTGGRIKRIKKLVENDEMFLLTYGDGVADVDLFELVRTHRDENALVTLTAVEPPMRFGVVEVGESRTVLAFDEKSQNTKHGTLINGGYFVLNPESLDFIEGDATSWEVEPLRSIAEAGRLAAYRHSGFWQCMDSQRDQLLLEDLVKSGRAPWMTWIA